MITSHRRVPNYLLTLIRLPKWYGLVSGDPLTPLANDLGFFTYWADFPPMCADVRFAMRIVDTDASLRKQDYQFVNLTVPESMSDKNMDTFVRKYVTSGYHHPSPCRMGAEPHGKRPSAVNAGLTVHGMRELRGLRVCDACVFPEIIRSHTMALTVMVAEKCVDMVKACWAR